MALARSGDVGNALAFIAGTQCGHAERVGDSFHEFAVMLARDCGEHEISRSLAAATRGAVASGFKNLGQNNALSDLFCNLLPDAPIHDNAITRKKSRRCQPPHAMMN